MKILLLGPPGAGKGTQAKIIENHFQLYHISTGDILRSVIRDGSDIGLKIKRIIDSGELVADDLIIDVLKNAILNLDTQNGFLLDGFPRTLNQAKALEDLEITFDYIIELTVETHTIIERISGRRIHESSGRVYHVKYNKPNIENRDDITGENLVHRDDDHLETIKKRIKIYNNDSKKLMNYYRNTLNDSITKVLTINGNELLSDVSKEIINKIKR